MEKVLISIIKSEHNNKLKKILINKIIDGNSSTNATTEFQMKTYLDMIEMYLIEMKEPKVVSFTNINLNEELYDIIKTSIECLLANQIRYQYDFYDYLNEHHLNEVLVDLKYELNEDNFRYFLLWLRINVDLLISKLHLTYDIIKNLIEKINSYLNKTQLLNKSFKLCMEYMKLVDSMLPILKQLADLNDSGTDKKPSSNIYLLNSISSMFYSFYCLLQTYKST